MNSPNPDDVAMCAEFVDAWKPGEKCKNAKCGVLSDDDGRLPNWQCYHPEHDISCPLPSPELKERIERKLLSEGVSITYDPPDGDVCLDDTRHVNIVKPDIYAACADYLRRGK